MEVEGYIDFHNNNDYNKDNTWRIIRALTDTLSFQAKGGSTISFSNNGNITANSINNISVNNFSLTTHNHDDRYSLIDHIHSDYLTSANLDNINNKLTGISYNKDYIETTEEEDIYEIYTNINQDLKVNGDVTCNTVNNISVNNFSLNNHTHYNTTGIYYNEELLETNEGEDIYEKYTLINQDLIVNGKINEIDTNNIAVIEDGILTISDVILFENGVNISTYNNTTEDGITENNILINFPNGNSIMLEDSGHTYGIVNVDGVLTSEYYLTKQMIIDDDEIQELLTRAPGEDGEGYKKNWLEYLLDAFSVAMSLAEFAELASKVYNSIKNSSWAISLISRLKNVFTGARGYIPIPTVRSVVFDEYDISTDENLDDLVGPDDTNIDNSFNEYNYLINLFPEMNVIFKNLKYYYKDVSKGQRTNELGMALVDCQIYKRFINHTHDNYLISSDLNNYTGITYHKYLIDTIINVEEEEEDIYEIYTNINQDLKVNGNIECSTINGIDLDELSVISNDIFNINNKLTGITYNKDYVETIEEEDIYEIYTSINQDLKINGNIECTTINGIDTNNFSLTTHTHGQYVTNDNSTNINKALTGISYNEYGEWTKIEQDLLVGNDISYRILTASRNINIDCSKYSDDTNI